MGYGAENRYDMGGGGSRVTGHELGLERSEGRVGDCTVESSSARKEKCVGNM